MLNAFHAKLINEDMIERLYKAAGESRDKVSPKKLVDWYLRQ